MIIEHIGVWVQDLDNMLAFYTDLLGGTGGDLYENPATGFRSRFVSFGDRPPGDLPPDNGFPGAHTGGDDGTGGTRGHAVRLELMSLPGVGPSPAGACFGYAHLAFRLPSRDAVDAMVARLRQQGVTVESQPRLTGDGYYEAVIADPEGNRVELMA